MRCMRTRTRERGPRVMANEIVGVAPQNVETSAQGVSLSRKEKRFLHALVKYTERENDDKLSEMNEKLYRFGERVGLREVDVRYLKEWVVCKGEHWMACEKAGIKYNLDMRKAYRNPVVRKFINLAASRGICFGTVASREELADFYTQRMRSDFLPEQFRAGAAESLARLMGYNPDDGKGGGGTVNVQINCVNPYGAVPEDAGVVGGEV